MKSLSINKTRQLISWLGILYLLHFFSINTLIAAPHSVPSVDYSGYLLYKTEKKCKDTTKKKRPYSLFITKHMVSPIVRLVNDQHSESPTVKIHTASLDMPFSYSYYNNSRELSSLPDDAYKRYRFYCSYLI